MDCEGRLVGQWEFLADRITYATASVERKDRAGRARRLTSYGTSTKGTRRRVVGAALGRSIGCSGVCGSQSVQCVLSFARTYRLLARVGRDAYPLQRKHISMHISAQSRQQGQLTHWHVLHLIGPGAHLCRAARLAGVDAGSGGQAQKLTLVSQKLPQGHLLLFLLLGRCVDISISALFPYNGGVRGGRARVARSKRFALRTHDCGGRWGQCARAESGATSSGAESKGYGEYPLAARVVMVDVWLCASGRIKFEEPDVVGEID